MKLNHVEISQNVWIVLRISMCWKASCFKFNIVENISTTNIILFIAMHNCEVNSLAEWFTFIQALPVLFASSVWSRRLKKPVIYSLLGKIQQSYLALRLLPPAHDSNTIQRHRVTWKSFHRSSTRSENGWNSTSITCEWRTGFCLLVQNNVKNICSHVSSSRDI